MRPRRARHQLSMFDRKGSEELHTPITMLANFLAVLSGWRTNLNAKKRIQAAGKAISSGTPDLNTDQKSGEVLGIEKFQSVHGLPGYPLLNFWQRLFASETPMELLFTRSSLIFCDPSASASLKRTAIPLVDVISARTDYNDGSILIIKSNCGTIRCDTERTLGAKPTKEILDNMLHEVVPFM